MSDSDAEYGGGILQKLGLRKQPVEAPVPQQRIDTFVPVAGEVDPATGQQKYAPSGEQQPAPVDQKNQVMGGPVETGTPGQSSGGVESHSGSPAPQKPEPVKWWDNPTTKGKILN